MPETKDIDVSDDHIILTQIMHEHKLDVYWLKNKIGRDQSTVSRYQSGNLPIPTVVWRVLYEKTQDVRIPPLVTGEVPVIVVDVSGTEFKGGIAAMDYLIGIRTEQIECEKKLLEILADGKIDASDQPLIEQYKKEFDEMVVAQVQTRNMIVKEAKRNGVL